MPSVLPSSPTLEQRLAALRAQVAGQPFPDAAQRVRWLDALAQLVQRHQHELAAAVNADFGQRSEVETRLAELFPTMEGIRHARRRLRGWMRPQRRQLSWWFRPARAQVMAQPLGVVGIIVPWNYPLFLALGPLSCALAAGNRVLLKMSELTPQTGQLLAQLLQRYLGDEVVQVVNGDVALARAFSALPFDHLLFTGSTAVGRQVMQAAAANLTPVTLELGGKSPLLVMPGYDPQRAARSIVAGKMMNAGQTCVAPDYLLVPRQEQAALLQAIRAAAAHSYPTLARNSDYSAIINQAHYQRLCLWRDEAVAAGAVVSEINPAAESSAMLAETRKLPLTLLEQVPAHCRVLQDEIFGPLLPVIAYDTPDEAVRYINAQPRPLALYLFDHQPQRVRELLQQTTAGGVTVNDTLLHVIQDDLPFGGIGPSGMGHYHGHEGFLTFSKLKPVLYQSRFNGAVLIAAPYGRVVQTMLRWMIGR